MTINENIDDKAIEAAAQSDAEFDRRGDLARLSKADRQRYLDRSRAALAATDKVRAKGWHESAKLFAVQVAQALGVKLNQLQFEMVIATLEVAFAAGLAKGEADRAALVAFIRAIAHNESDPSEPVADNGMTVWDCIRKDALSLARKGV